MPIAGFVFLILASLAISAEPSAFDIMKHCEQQTRGKSSYMRGEIRIEKSRINRSMVVDSWETKESNQSFIRILRPKKDKGVTFLKLDRNLWQYIPKISKEIKIEESLMQDSWMGSDFTNDDLVKSSSIVDDYNHSFMKSEDPLTYKILMKPKPGSVIIWEKVIAFVLKKEELPQRYDYYDHKGRLVKRMDFSDYKKMGGRMIPATFTMQTIKGKRTISKTTMRYMKIRFDLNIPSSIFSKANLRR